MNKPIFRFLLSFMLLTGFMTGYSQTMPFVNYTIQEGLPQSTVYCLFQDREGHLWAGTQGGACSFDGQDFQVWDSQLGLPDNHVTSITQGVDGTIWFGHLSGALSFLKNNKVHSFRNASLINTSKINSMAWKDQQLYLATQGNGLYCLSFRSSPVMVRHFTRQDGLTSDTLNQITDKNAYQFWLATAEGLSIWDVKQHRPVLRNAGLQAVIGPVNSICQLPDSTIWCGTPLGAIHMDPVHPSAAYQRITQAEGLLNANIQKVVTDQKGNVWLATQLGIARINRQGIRCFTRSNGLLSDLTYDLLPDREGYLWISQDDGISYYKDTPFELYTPQDGLVNPEVYSIQEYEPDCYWIGTAGGISIFKPKAPPLERFRNLTTQQGLPGNFIYKIFIDSRKNIWIGTIGHGVACYLSERKEFLIFNQRNGLAGKNVVSIGEDRHGRIWFGTLDAGIAVFRYDTHTMRSYQAGQGFVSNGVWTIHRDTRQQLWFGTKDQGLVWLNDRTDRFEIVPGQANLPNHNFGSISSDREGNIWIASIGGGIFRYNGQTFRQYGTRQGLKSNNPYFIHCDSIGRVWLGTNVGIDLFNASTLKVVSFGKREGFIGIETNQNAVCQDKKGHLWFGTVNGLVHVDSVVKREPTISPVVQIFSPHLFFEEANLNPGQKLSYNQNYLTFDFRAISLAYPDNIRYRYQLRGLDTQWSPALSESHASYTNLPAGSYTFLVEAGFPESKWSKPASFSFVIEPPFWKTWWFIVLACSLGGTIISVAYQYRVAHLLKLERMRSEIALDLHDDIGSALSSIALYSDMLMQNTAAEPARTTPLLENINQNARRSVSAINDLIWTIKPDNDVLERTLVRMKEFAIPLMEAKNINFDFQIADELRQAKLNMATRKILYMVFKEAINNALKYAQASQVRVQLIHSNRKISLVIADNGKGFDVQSVRLGNGLGNMQKRAAQINGLFTIDTAPGKGCIVRLVFKAA